MFKDLTSLGFKQNKSKTLSFPMVPKKYFSDFVHGYFDGDGCVYFKRHYAKDRGKERWVFQTSFTSGSLDFLNALFIKLHENKLSGGFITTKGRGYELKFSRRDSLALYKIMYNNGSATLCLDRKKDIFEKAFEQLGYNAAVV